MERKIVLLIIILFIPIIVNAKEYCTVVSGNGKDIGSEIACGSEHFYIFDNTGDEIKMLGKYNLYVGANFDKIKLDINETYIQYELCNHNEAGCNCKTNGQNSFYYSCSNTKYYFEGHQVNTLTEFTNRIKERYNVSLFDELDSIVISYGDIAVKAKEYSEKFIENNKEYIKETYKLYPYTSITEETNGFGIQNKNAKGVTGAKGNANYPIYATIHLFPSSDDNGSTILNMIENQSIFKYGYVDFNFKENTTINHILDNYKSKLFDYGYNVSNVDIITIKDLNNFVKTIVNEELPLEDWYNYVYYDDDYYDYQDEIAGNDSGLDTYYFKGDLKEFIPKEYSWVWDTTYWTRTFSKSRELGNEDTAPTEQVYFISSEGELCSSRSDECSGMIPRAGIRPVVTITKDNIKYSIKTKTDGKGTIEVIDTAYGGDSITFRVSSKKGYKLSSLTITTDSGEIVEFNEEDIKNNSDGTISISTNKFTMPYENVLIQARWSSTIINPNTGSTFIFIFLILIVIDSIVIYKNINQKKQEN